MSYAHPLDATVAICTWNRADLLDRTLTSFHSQAVPNSLPWELLIIDNNCTDHTAAVIAKHADRVPIRGVVEMQQGHSHARNRAVAEARGRLILWTDDDVQVPPNWIAEYMRVANEFPEAAYFGGRVVPWFSDELSSDTRKLIESNWKLLQPVYSLKDYGPETRLFAQEEGPFGCNMAFRADRLRQFPFDPRLGRVKSGLIGGDEVAVVRAMQLAELSGVWIGSSEVKHYIPVDRTRLGHFWRYYFALGRTHVRLHGVDPCATLAGRPRWALYESVKLQMRGWFRRQRGAPNGLADTLKAAWLAGLAHETAHTVTC